MVPIGKPTAVPRNVRQFTILGRLAPGVTREAANAELARAMQESGRYGPEVQTAVDHFHDAMGDLQNETVLHIFEMRSLLTPEQAARFDQRVGEALTQDAQ